jgi:hypothetical protein
MPDNSREPAKEPQVGEVWLFIFVRYVWSEPGIMLSIAGAALLLAWDAAIGGTFLTSLLICPIWFLASVVKNAIQRPGWVRALVRIAIPALTLGLALANDDFHFADKTWGYID